MQIFYPKHPWKLCMSFLQQTIFSAWTVTTSPKCLMSLLHDIFPEMTYVCLNHKFKRKIWSLHSVVPCLKLYFSWIILHNNKHTLTNSYLLQRYLTSHSYNRHKQISLKSLVTDWQVLVLFAFFFFFDERNCSRAKNRREGKEKVTLL